jgi:hypothetical protein
MSIVTLKKKTAARYNNNSCNVPQFSLNGCRRSQGYIGQDSRGRSLPKTIMKGNTPKGHGGCCGKYNITPIVQSAVISLNDSNVVKTSVLGTDGMIATKYRWILRPRPFSMTKYGDSFNKGASTQQQYITNISKTTLATADNSSCQVKRLPPTKCTNSIFRKDANNHLSNMTTECMKNTKSLTDPIATPKYRVAMSQGDYIQRLDGNCSINDKKFSRPTTGFPTFGHC